METFDIKGKRILEVGCGVGLTSLMLNSRIADITATDHHPEAEAYLQLNVDLNEGRTIPFVRTGWEQKDASLGEYDLIVGSDVLYQPNHALLLSSFVNRHAKEKCESLLLTLEGGMLRSSAMPCWRLDLCSQNWTLWHLCRAVHPTRGEFVVSRDSSRREMVLVDRWFSWTDSSHGQIVLLERCVSKSKGTIFSLFRHRYLRLLISCACPN